MKMGEGKEVKINVKNGAEKVTHFVHVIYLLFPQRRLTNQLLYIVEFLKNDCLVMRFLKKLKRSILT